MDSNSTAIHAYLTIEGHQFKTLIDTGASISLLSEEALQTLGREVQEQDAAPAMTVDRSLTDMRGLVRQVQVKVADLTFSSTFRIMGKTSYPVILGWDFLKQAKGVIIASRMVLQVSQNGQDVEIPIFDTTTSKPEDAQVQRKPYYAEDAEFEMVNATQAIEYIDLGERSWGQVFHKTYQAIAGTRCKYHHNDRAEEHHMHYLQIKDKSLWPTPPPIEEPQEPEGWPTLSPDADLTK
jgi:hypothetical protein